MKSVRIKEMLKVAVATVAAVGLFGSMLLGANQLSLHAATAEETALPPAVAYVNIPENPVPEEYQTRNMTVIDTTQLNCDTWQMGLYEIDPLALSPDEAAAIGAQYIYDIFGVCINGMYVDMEFTSWWGFGRLHWRGDVTSTNRNTLEQRAQMQRLNAEFMARYEAGESRESLARYFDMTFRVDFTMPEFSFTVDAITGERIDIWYNSPFATRPVWIPGDGSFEESRMYEEQRILREYIKIEWSDDWQAAFSSALSHQELAVLYEIAWHYGQRQFNNTAVDYVEFSGAHNNLAVDANDNIVRTAGSAVFEITDETGRIAMLVICLDSLSVTSINSSRHDFRTEELIERGYLYISSR